MKQAANKKLTKHALKTGLPSQPIAIPAETTSGLPELLAEGIKSIYWAENHLVLSLPKMIAAAGSPLLKSGLTAHLEVTRQHVSRLEKAFEMLNRKVQAKKCEACAGLTMSGEQVIEITEPGSEARNTGLIMASLKVENYEITSYNGLIELAAKLGKTDVAELLRQNLTDEMEAEQLLTNLNNNDAEVQSQKNNLPKKTRMGSKK